MTYHGGGGQLSAAVVGFDYQRAMVAAAAALLGLFTAPHQQQQQLQQSHKPQSPHCLLVGLGAGSCAAALHHYGTAAAQRPCHTAPALARDTPPTRPP